MLRTLSLILLAVALIGIISFRVKENISSKFNVITEYAVDGNAEIIASSADGRYLIHTNSN
ncbi:MAG: hypothetical protein ACR2QG_09850, partial [Gammaproteobacteria bacterium]